MLRLQALSLALAGLLAIKITAATAAGSSRPCRDRWLEPFHESSIWNTAIGSGAKFFPAGLFAHGDYRGLPGNFHNDQDWLVRTTLSDPITTWINQGDWNSEKHGMCDIVKGRHSGQPCGPETTLIDGCHAQIRLPRTFTTASDCVDGPPNPTGSNCFSPADHKNNNAMALLLPDNETLVQMQPVYRCGYYPAPFLARWGNNTDGGPQNFDNVTSIFGKGVGGAHGGSGLSSIGGSIRLGELDPKSGPIGHALKIELGNWWYYGDAQLQPATVANGHRTQYVWPATGSNAQFVNGKATAYYTGKNKYLAPGALLAIPASQATTVKSTTPIGKKIRQAMIDYGAYIVDGSGHGENQDPLRQNCVAICMDAEVNSEMRARYNWSMAYPHGVQRPDKATGQTPEQNELYNDLLNIFRALQIVTNNGPDNVGGGGKPRVPTKAPVCGAPTP